MKLKTCSKCGEEKDLVEGFYADARNKDGRQGTCKGCIKTASGDWKGANRDRVNEAKRKSYKASPEKTKARGDRWRRRNPEKVAAKMARWAKGNREYKRAAASKRRAIQRGYQGLSYSKQDIQIGLLAQQGCCWYCGVRLAASHVDHVYPLARGGGNGPDNVVLACPSCNMSKGDRLLGLEWVPPLMKLSLDKSRFVV